MVLSPPGKPVFATNCQMPRFDLLFSKKWSIQSTSFQTTSCLPPVKIKYMPCDLVVTEEDEFLNLCLALNISVMSKEYLQVPYDYFCPSVKPRLSNRTCRECGLYNVSNKSATRHRKDIHRDHGEKCHEPRLCPVRVASCGSFKISMGMKMLSG